MSETKATSFRINDDDNEKFKEFLSENGYPNQAEGFKAIMQTVEMAKAKGQIKDRAKEIEVFQDTINNLMGMFLNSLQVNQTSEERIREELRKEILTKEDTIDTLNQQVKELKEDRSNLNKDLNDAKEAIKGWMDSNDELKDEIIKQRKDLEDKQKSIDILNKSNINQLEQLEQYKDLKITNDQLLNRLEEFETSNLSLENTNKQLLDKIKNSEDMIEFYKNSISDLKGDIESYKEDIKDLGVKYDKQIEGIKVDYEKSLDKEKVISDQLRVDLHELDEKYQSQVKETKAEYENTLNKEIESFKEQLTNKHSLELDKKDLIIDKLKSQIEKSSVKKPRSTKNTPTD